MHNNETTTHENDDSEMGELKYKSKLDSEIEDRSTQNEPSRGASPTNKNSPEKSALEKEFSKLKSSKYQEFYQF